MNEKSMEWKMLTDVMPRIAKLFVFLYLLSSLPLVFAEHEPNHRYRVVGTVSDANGNPLPDAEVIASDSTIGLTERGFTDKNGKYIIQLHLHDENNGDELTISAKGVSFNTEAKFDSSDHATERGIRLDLTGGKWVLGEFQQGVDITSGVLLLVIILGVALYLGTKSSSKSSETSTKKLKKKKR